MSKGYRSPRNVVFLLMERGGLFTLDDIAFACHLHHNTAERVLNSLVSIGKIRQDGKWFMVEDRYQAPWVLATWDILAERLLERMTQSTPRHLWYCNVWAKFGFGDLNASDQTGPQKES